MDKKNYSALIAVLISTTIYSLTENSWFNSWLKGIVGGSDFDVTVMASLSAVFGAIFFIIWGAVSDNIRSKWGRRKPLLVIGLVASAIVVFAFIAVKNILWCIIIDGIILSIFSNMFWANRHAIVPDLTEIHERGKINSVLFIFGGIGGLAITIIEIWAPYENGYFSERAHLMVITICVLSLLFSAIWVAFTLHESPNEFFPPPRNWIHDLRAIFDLNELKSHQEFYKLLIALIILASARYAYFPLYIIFRQEMGFNSLQKSLYFVGMGLGTVLGTVLLPKYSDQFGRKKVMLFTIPFALIGLILCPFTPYNFVFFFIGNFLLFFGFEGMMRLQEVWGQDLADEDARGKFLGIFNLSQSVGRVPGALLAGWFAGIFGTSVIFITASIFVIAALPILIRVKDRVVGIDSN
jgi:melibiose permease/lactose/raffinose/galactose permease